MRAIVFRKSIPRYLALKALRQRAPGGFTGPFSLIDLRDALEPKLPSPQWVRVRPVLSGVCGSDLATICAKGSAYLSPLTSTPFVLGHEMVGIVTDAGEETGASLSVGDRVVLQPALGCVVRGIDPPCASCASGATALCRNVTRGDISAGIQTGYCRDTGGAWSDGLVAHPSQLYKVPQNVPDEAAVLCEPLACCVHAVLKVGMYGNGDREGAAIPGVHRDASKEGKRTNDSTLTPAVSLEGRGSPAGRSTVVVLGCGSIGLLTIAALRALGSRTSIIAVARYAHQKDHARALGADEIVGADRESRLRYERLAAVLGAELHQPELGKPTVIGGADVVFDCIASSESIDDACRFTTAGGTMALVGMPAIPRGIDWTTIWYKELRVQAAYAYGVERCGAREMSTFDLALEMLARQPDVFLPLVGKPFALEDYRGAIRAALHTGASRSVKTVFRISSGDV